MRDNDKVIKVAKIISAIFNPFVVPFFSVPCFIFLLLSEHASFNLQANCIGNCIRFYYSVANDSHFLFQENQRVGIWCIQRQEKAFCSLSVNHYLLCLLSGNDGKNRSAQIYDRNYTCNTDGYGYLYCCEYKMEDQ